MTAPCLLHALSPAPSPLGQGRGRKSKTPSQTQRVLPTATPQEGRQSPKFSRNMIARNPVHFCISLPSVNNPTVMR